MRARMPKLNRQTLFSYTAPLSPISKQQSFATRVTDIQAMIDQQDRMATTSDQLMNSLMSEVFGG